MKHLRVLKGTEKGKIKYFNYKNDADKNWLIKSNCDQVQITSTMFDTEECCDMLIIDKTSYSGNTTINQLVEKRTFNVQFISDSTTTGNGFLLKWGCSLQTAAAKTVSTTAMIDEIALNDLSDISKTPLSPAGLDAACIGEPGKYCTFYRQIKSKTIEKCQKLCKRRDNCFSFSFNIGSNKCRISRRNCKVRRHSKWTLYGIANNCTSTSTGKITNYYVKFYCKPHFLSR